MREIKFRAWDKRQIEIYGTGMSYGEPEYFDDMLAFRFNHFESDNPAEIVYEQYTGLKDKNGNEIYEGDIVKIYHVRLVSDAPIHQPRLANIEWSVDDCGFRLVGPDVRSTNPDLYPTSHLEVIGNIHENPELLEYKP